MNELNYRLFEACVTVRWSYAELVRTGGIAFISGSRSLENYIKKLKADLSLNSFNVNDLYETETALGFVMQEYNLMNLSLGKPCTWFGTTHPCITRNFQ